MIKATELRIGNYVNLEDKGVYQIDSGHDIDEIDSFPNEEEYSKGVNITEDSLSLIGFTKRSEGVFSSTYSDVKVSIYFQGEGKTRIHFFMSGGNKLMVDYFKYIHQIQNLYYYLYATELKKQGFYFLNFAI